ncbi:CRISPR/Cas system CSM-associated protein Csm2 small subunit [Flavobacterium sp. PL11]|uniref:PH domain-containing protein n=1 Tax=Flavobacterium sp. PL11 TaxID=3071717 RepID=UPI002E09DF36|nr:CRISPR/Cas system CSM-associated protein Csm2 small subunit [Flavobacterium sp. PL11]
MKEQFKNFLNEEQDPKAIEKIASKLSDLLMKNEEIGYIAVQKKPAITVLPDSIVLTNKRIIICQPKNLGLSMDFIDYNWDTIEDVFVKENILGSEFSFATNVEMTITIDYLPKTQARKIYTYAKEQLEMVINVEVMNAVIIEETIDDTRDNLEVIEEIETEEVTSFLDIMPSTSSLYNSNNEKLEAPIENTAQDMLKGLSQDELFEKLQNYKKLLDNGLILQGEYDAFKKEILNHM